MYADSKGLVSCTSYNDSSFLRKDTQQQCLPLTHITASSTSVMQLPVLGTGYDVAMRHLSPICLDDRT